ncbi:Endonuclease III-like protein 1 [Halotydeus destructor]|nr:Endonuclease III-like protein 1 [Halotydeus destructor]
MASETISKYFAVESGPSTRSKLKKQSESVVKIENIKEEVDVKEQKVVKVKSARKRTNLVKVEYESVKQEVKPKEKLEESGDSKVSKWEPDNWLTVLDNIKKMRIVPDAPVDTMGCHMCHDDDEEPRVKRFQMLVALMLSSQTKDPTTYAAMQRLKQAGLSPEKVVAIDGDKLGQLIKPVNFYKRKTVFLKGAARICLDQYGGDIPDTYDGLCKIPGVGPKMAHLTMMTAWNKVTGIAVDTHVHRICNRLAWLRKPSTDPKKTMDELEAWLPFEHWQSINHVLVGFGQTVCLPVKPKCGDCLNSSICPAADLSKKGKGK